MSVKDLPGGGCLSHEFPLGCIPPFHPPPIHREISLSHDNAVYLMDIGP